MRVWFLSHAGRGYVSPTNWNAVARAVGNRENLVQLALGSGQGHGSAEIEGVDLRGAGQDYMNVVVRWKQGRIRHRRAFLAAARARVPTMVLPSGERRGTVGLEAGTLEAYPRGTAGVPIVLIVDEDNETLFFADLGEPLSSWDPPEDDIDRYPEALTRRFSATARVLAGLHLIPRGRFRMLGASCTPDSTETWFSLRWMLKHNELGRRLRGARQRSEQHELDALARQLDNDHPAVDPVVCKGMVGATTTFWNGGRCSLLDYSFVRSASSAWDLADLSGDIACSSRRETVRVRRSVLETYVRQRAALGRPAPPLKRLAAAVDWHHAVICINRLDLDVSALRSRKLAAKQRQEIGRRIELLKLSFLARISDDPAVARFGHLISKTLREFPSTRRGR